MVTVEWIFGVKVGIEYGEYEDVGFVLAVDFGCIRFIWFKDLVEE